MPRGGRAVWTSVCPRGGVGRAREERRSPPRQRYSVAACTLRPLLGFSRSCWPVRSTAVRFLHKRSSPLAPRGLFPESTIGLVSASVLLPVSKFSGPEDGPFSLSLSFSVSQMAILLTAAKKTLHSTVHISPGALVELSEFQPPLSPSEERLFLS